MLEQLGDILGVILCLFPIIASIVAFLPRRRRGQRVAPSTPLELPPAYRLPPRQYPPFWPTLGALVAQSWRSVSEPVREMVIAYKLTIEHQRGARILSSSPPAPPSRAPILPPMPPPKHEARSTKHEAADVELGKYRVKAVMLMTAAGLEFETIYGVVEGNPEAIKTALKSVKGRWLGYAMRGTYQENLLVIDAVRQQALQAQREALAAAPPTTEVARGS